MASLALPFSAPVGSPSEEEEAVEDNGKRPPRSLPGATGLRARRRPRQLLALAGLLLALALAGPPLSSSSSAWAQEAEEEEYRAAVTITDNVLGEYRDAALDWTSRLGGLARALFFSLLTLQGLIFFGQVALGAYRDRPVAGVASRFTKFVLFALFGAALVLSSEVWVEGVYDGFVGAASLATGEASPPAPGAVGMQGFSLAYELNTVEDETATGRSWLPGLFSGAVDNASPSNNIVFWAGIGIVLVFIGIAIQLFITQAAFFITLGSAPFFLAWAGFRPTSGLTEGYLKFALYISIKMFVLFLLVGIATEVPAQVAQLFTESAPDTDSWGWIGDIPGVHLLEDYYEYVSYRTRVATSILLAVACTGALVIGVPGQFATRVTRPLNIGLSEMLDF